MSQPSTPTLEPPRSDPNNFLASPEKEENPENQSKLHDTTQFIESKEIEIENINKIPLKKIASEHQENLINEINKLKEQIKWLNDVIVKKDHSNEEMFKENKYLKEEIMIQENKINSLKIFEMNCEEIKILKKEVEKLKEINILQQIEFHQENEKLKSNILLAENKELIEEKITEENKFFTENENTANIKNDMLFKYVFNPTMNCVLYSILAFYLVIAFCLDKVYVLIGRSSIRKIE